ncbi:SH3 domain-containing protein [Nitrospirota bacterium]
MKKLLTVILAVIFITISAGNASALCVKEAEANLRSGPGTQYEKLWEVFQYMPFKKISKKGQWYKIQDVAKDVYWIYAPLTTSSYKCAVVKDDKANIRKGPGTNHEQTSASPAMKYYSFKVLKIKGDWVQVKDEYGDTGWIFKPLLWIQ